MAWAPRRGQMYYYRHRRRDGKVVREYVGRGPAARLAAELDEADRRRRAEESRKQQAWLEELASERKGQEDFFAEIEHVIRATLLVSGYYYWNRRSWRRRRIMQSSPATAPSQTLPKISVPEIVTRANAGDPAALEALRRFLDENPEIWKRIGDLAWHRLEDLLKRIGGDGPQASLLAESARKQARALHASLLPPQPLPVHILAVDRVVLSYIELHHMDSCQPDVTSESAKLAVAYQRARDAAQRRYLAALKSLATLVKLLPAKPRGPKLHRPQSKPPRILKVAQD